MTYAAWEAGSEDRFWQIVTRCLVEFFAYGESAAQRKVASYRVELDDLELHQPRLVYHDEPINVASDLAGKPLDLDLTKAERYRSILQEVA